MKDEDKTKEQLIDELVEVCQQITELEALETERKRAEEEFRKVQERFSGIYNSSKDAIGYSTLEGVLLDVNDSFLRLTGYSREELLDRRKYQDITPEEYQEYEAQMVENVLRTGEPVGYEKKYVRKDGSRVPILLTVFIVRGTDGEPIGLAAIIKDITERKRAEEVLRESESRTRAIVNTAVDAIITIDEQGIVESFNPAAERIFGYTADEVIGQNVKILMSLPYHEEHDGYLANYLTTGKKKIIGIGREVMGRHKDGTIFPMDLAVSEVCLGERRIFTGIMRDITERRVLYEKSQKQAE